MVYLQKETLYRSKPDQGVQTSMKRVTSAYLYVKLIRVRRTLLSPDMAKLSFQKTNHRWCSLLVQKEEFMRPVVESGWGEPFYSSLFIF